MNGQVANSKALGFGVLGIALWMMFVVHAGIAGTPGSIGFGPHVMHVVNVAAMLGLLIAGLAAFLRKESWLGFFFLLWAGLCWGSAHMGQGGMEGGLRYAGWFLMCIALVNFYLWVATLKSSHLGLAVSAVVLLIWVAFLLLGLRIFFNLWVLVRAGGAVGLAAALVAFYVSFGALASEHCPGIKLPGIWHKPATTAPASPSP